MTTSRARKTVFLQQDEEELLTLAAWAVLRAGMPQAVGCWGSSLMPCVFFLQSQQVTQSWVILKSTNNKTAGHTCAAQPHDTGSVRGLWWESSVTYSACWRARLCRHTCLTLTSRKPVAGSTLLSLISIIREDVRGEPALISLSKAPCQLGNLCTGLWCTTQRISCDWAFALPTVSSDFSVAKNHMLLRQCCLITWECSETSPLLKAASLKGGATGVLQINVCTPPIAHTQVSSSTVPLYNLFLRERDPILFVMYLVF